MTFLSQNVLTDIGDFFLNLEALNNENFKFVLPVIVSIAKAWTLGLTRQWRTRLSPPLGVSTVKLPFQTSHDGHTPFLPETIFTNFILLTRYQQKQTLKNIDRILSNKINKSYFYLVLFLKLAFEARKIINICHHLLTKPTSVSRQWITSRKLPQFKYSATHFNGQLWNFVTSPYFIMNQFQT